MKSSFIALLFLCAIASGNELVRPIVPESFVMEAECTPMPQFAVSAVLKADAKTRQLAVDGIVNNEPYIALRVTGGKKYEFFGGCTVHDVLAQDIDTFDFPKLVGESQFAGTESFDKQLLYKWVIMKNVIVYNDENGKVLKLRTPDNMLFKITSMEPAVLTAKDFIVPNEWNCSGEVPHQVRPLIPSSFQLKTTMEPEASVRVETVSRVWPEAGRLQSSAFVAGQVQYAVVATGGKQYSYMRNECQVEELTKEQAEVFDLPKLAASAEFNGTETVNNQTLYRWFVPSQSAIWWCDEFGTLKQMMADKVLLTVTELISMSFTSKDFQVPAEWNCPSMPEPEPTEVRPIVPASFVLNGFENNRPPLSIEIVIKADGPNKRVYQQGSISGQLQSAFIVSNRTQYVYFGEGHCSVDAMGDAELELCDYQKAAAEATFVSSGIVRGETMYQWSALHGFLTFWCDVKGVVKQLNRGGPSGETITVTEIVPTTFTDYDFAVPVEWGCKGVAPQPTPPPTPVARVYPRPPASFYVKANSAAMHGMDLVAEMKFVGAEKRLSMTASLNNEPYIAFVIENGKAYEYYDENCRVMDLSPADLEIFDLAKWTGVAEFAGTEVVNGKTLFKWNLPARVSVVNDENGNIVRVITPDKFVFVISELTPKQFTDEELTVPSTWKCPGTKPEPKAKPTIPASLEMKGRVAMSIAPLMKLYFNIKTNRDLKMQWVTLRMNGMNIMQQIVDQQAGKTYEYQEGKCSINEGFVQDPLGAIEMAEFAGEETIEGKLCDKWHFELDVTPVAITMDYYFSEGRLVKFSSSVLAGSEQPLVTEFFVDEVTETKFTMKNFEVPKGWKCKPSNPLTLRRAAPKVNRNAAPFGIVL